MLVQRGFIFLTLAVIFATLECSINHQKFCGDYLSTILAKLCNYNYNKRTYSNKESLVLNAVPVKRGLNPFITKENALEILPPKFRRDDNIVDECCIKGCSLAELRMYCAA